MFGKRKAMKTCIYCNKEKDDSEFSLEHIFPDALGGALLPDAIFKTNDVCIACNSTSGLFIDGPFIKNWFLTNDELRRRKNISIRERKRRSVRYPTWAPLTAHQLRKTRSVRCGSVRAGYATITSIRPTSRGGHRMLAETQSRENPIRDAFIFALLQRKPIGSTWRCVP